MMTLSSTAGYAIRALACLASKECEQAMIARVAECSGVPAAYLAKIMKRLNHAGIVGSKRGFRGGIWLIREPGQITLLEIMNAIDGPDYLNGCLLGHEFCTDERACPTHVFWKGTREKIREELAAHTLADVVAFNARRRGKASARARRAAALSGVTRGA